MQQTRALRAIIAGFSEFAFEALPMVAHISAAFAEFQLCITRMSIVARFCETTRFLLLRGGRFRSHQYYGHFSGVCILRGLPRPLLLPSGPWCRARLCIRTAALR